MNLENTVSFFMEGASMKAFYFLFFIILFSFLITGCKKEQKTNEISFIPQCDTSRNEEFYIVSDMKNFESLEAVISKFHNYYPNVNIIYEYLGDYENMIEKRLKNDPSVACFTSTGPAGIDLTPFNFDTSAFGTIIESTKNEGRLQGIPIGIDLSGVMVNKTLLAKENIKIPETKDEFDIACYSLIDKGYIPPIQQNLIYGSRYMFTPYICSELLKIENRDTVFQTLTSGKKGCTEILRPLIEEFNRVYDLGFFPKNENSKISDEYDSAILNFFNGDVPFLPVSSDTISGMKKRESKSPYFLKNPFEYGFIFMPMGETGCIAAMDSWRTMCVSSYTEHMEMAVEFLRFLGTTEMLDLLARIKGLPSATKIQTDPRFLFMNNAKGEYIYLWDRQIPSIIYSSIATRLGELFDGQINSVNELLEILVDDFKNVE